MKKDDTHYMQQALLEAEKALEKGEVPVGAIVVWNGRVVARGHNQPLSGDDPTAHAEIVAIREACRRRKNYRIPDCELYVTLEPCAMCLGTVVQARVKRLVFGALDPKNGAVQSIMKFPFEKTNHCLEIEQGVLAEESSILLKAFFKARRK
ncbi:MAG: tRNA adenosine(34) deaminase TadA [Candidatus Aminicenantales bacterium]